MTESQSSQPDAAQNTLTSVAIDESPAAVAVPATPAGPVSESERLVALDVLLAGSVLWLKYFRFGPLEWLWRAFIYRRMPAIR